MYEAVSVTGCTCAEITTRSLCSEAPYTRMVDMASSFGETRTHFASPEGRSASTKATECLWKVTTMSYLFRIVAFSIMTVWPDCEGQPQ